MKQITRQECIDEMNKAFSISLCFHPEASSSTCIRISSAHTISRGSSLEKIAVSGKVYHFPQHIADMLKLSNDVNPIEVGINRASVFRGFCNHHDNTTFSEIDQGSFELNPKNIFLIGYRSFCQELFNKQAALNLIPFFRMGDKGKPIDEQRNIQDGLDGLELGLKCSLDRLASFKQKYDRLLLKEDYSCIKYLVIQLDCIPAIQCSGTIQPEHDFTGDILQDIANLGMLELFSYSIIAAGNSGLIVFAWLDDLQICERFALSYLSLPRDKMPPSAVILAFEYLSNVYFSCQWWNGLKDRGRQAVRDRVISGLWGRRSSLDISCADELQILWNVKSLVTNLDIARN